MAHFEEKDGGIAVERHHGGDGKLVPKITITNNTSEVFCVRFSPDGNFLAAGCGECHKGGDISTL